MTWFTNLKVRSKLLAAFVLILVIAVCVNVFTLIQYGRSDAAYSKSIDITEQQFKSIFDVKDQFTKARMIVREIYYPNNTAADINALYAELDTALAAASDGISQLRQIAAGDVRSMADEILSMLDKYRTDTEAVVDTLRNVGYVDIEDPAYRNAMRAAQVATNKITTDYAGTLSDNITALSQLQLTELQGVSAVLSDSAAKHQIMMIIILAIMTIIIMLIALYIPGLISKPLAPLTAFMKKADATGDIVLSPAEVAVFSKYSKYKDETGQLIGAATEFMNGINHKMDVLEKVADGNLDVQSNILSDRDRVGRSLTKVVDSLNDMFAEIQSTASQVSIGSKQIADGAQSLAQGTTEQAASIEELSASVAEIADSTKENATIANKTSQLSETIRENAEKGSRQMDEMITAVGEINEASKNISKIIKTIDDIAFQTNILALNAAVEAARAGQHGKGFAVVAEEVRNLASKSAEAAKDTGDLIQNAMEKAELGVRIAGETAESLKGIVAGINESSKLMVEIAGASEQQSLGISQINIGIEQVAQVVQQNSATAEESAAASEEMSGQSDMLQQYVEQFKLRGSDSKYRSLPTGEKPARKRPVPAGENAFALGGAGGDSDKY